MSGQDSETSTTDAADSAAPPSAGVGVRELETLVGALEEELRGLRDGYLRARADLENYRKRAARERDDCEARAVADAITPILEILDDLDRALVDSGGDAGALATGVRMIRDKTERRLSELGIVPIDPAGERFDPSRHEAIGATPTADVAADTILHVVRRGFQRGDRVLRPARVIVAVPASEEASGPRADSARS